MMTDGIDPTAGSSSGGMETDTTDPSTTSTTTPPPDGCQDGEQNGTESDVDCGGDMCDPCAAGSSCEIPEDCATMICSGGFCQTPNCYDGMQNGDEEGVDCGGTCPNSCVASGCTNNNQCEDGEYCDTDTGQCEMSSCENGVQDTLESDVDCGGSDCPPCGDDAACGSDADCESGVCDPNTNVCVPASCMDMVLNGDESDTDCGGSCPDPCPIGGECQNGDDCVDGVCEFNTCVQADCTDMVFNGDETDTDCGGSCVVDCVVGEMCLIGDDCVTGVCDPMTLLCAGAICTDMVLNGDETDVDCGGSCGATCEVGELCGGSGDCIEGVCEFGVCSMPDCGDGVENGDETDLDCGGSCGATCQPTEGCMVDGDCEQGVCDTMAGTCAFPACNDTVQNQDETDVDCGGAVCGATCDTDEVCFGDDDCISGVCTLALCQDPTCDDEVMNGLEDGVDCGVACPFPCPIGGEETVNTTTTDFQTQPAIATAPDASFSVVVWSSFPVAALAQDGSGSGVFAQMYDNTGAPMGGEFQVNGTGADAVGNQEKPSVDAYNGGFVVTWESESGDGDGEGVRFRRFDSTGSALGSEATANETTGLNQQNPDIGLDASGNFVICWEAQVSTFEIFCRLFGAGGVAATGEFQVNTTTANSQQLPVVDRSAGGDFVVAWQSAGDQDGDQIGVFARAYGAAGAAATPEFQVNTTTTGNQQEPYVGVAPAGNYTIIWTSDDADSTGIFAQRYLSNNTASGSEFLVNTTTAGAQNGPAVAYNSAGDSIAVWQTANDGALTGIFGQRYDSTGAAISVEFGVNQTIAGLQEDPDVAMFGDNEIWTVYNFGPSNFSDRDIGLQRTDGQFQ
jgi:DUF971 family protein